MIDNTSSISRRIPIDQIVITEFTNARFKIDSEVVREMKLLYESNHGVPPIEVQVIQPEDQKKPQYALIRGINRLTAQRELHFKEVQAVVDISPAIIILDSGIDLENFNGSLACQAQACHGSTSQPGTHQPSGDIPGNKV